MADHVDRPSLWSDERISPGKEDDEHSSESHNGHRSNFEKDFDRILFSTPVRRLSGKTQVFPLDNNDGVRTRLTHSHEVSNLARSIGARIAYSDPTIFEGQDVNKVILPLLGAAGLSHDLGNPPFGHQGEAAISRWFSDREKWIFDRRAENDSEHIDPIDNDFRAEFTKFDGNPQTIRLLTRLQTSQGRVGLDLTAATIAASLKYPVSAKNVDPENPIAKKFGYFLSEANIVQWAWAKTGLEEGQRHPLAWIMEAADDIAYSVLDVEDAMKKGIISPNDLINVLYTSKCDGALCEVIEADFRKAEGSGRPPDIVRDIKIAYARSRLVSDLVGHASQEFQKHKSSIFSYNHFVSIMETSQHCETLKDIAKTYAFGNSEVLFVEAQGRRAIDELLSAFWEAISQRKKDPISSRRSQAFSRYVYSLFSSNYIEAAEDCAQFGDHNVAKRMRYRETRLLTDMISGMTDTFALDINAKIQALK